MDDGLVGYADKFDLDRYGHDFWVSREQGKNTIPLFTYPLRDELKDVLDALGLSVMYGVVGDTQRRFIRIKDKDGKVVFTQMERNT